MIKFDLEKALAGEKVITRKGHDATNGYHFKSITDSFPVLFVVGGERVWVTTHGRRQALDVDDSLDLFMAPKKLSGFVNVYRGAENDYMGTIRKTEGECRADIESANHKVLMHIDLSQFEEGYGL